MLRLVAGRDALYYGPNDRWPLTRLHAIPQWKVTPEDVAAVSAGLSAVHVKLKGGQDLVFVPMFVTSRSIVEALALRGYRAAASST